MIRRFFVLLALPGLTLLGVSGCSKPALDPAVVAKHRTALLLGEEPDGAQTVLEVREVMFGAPAETGVPHDHDGDGVADHAPEDHPAEEEATEGADHDHDGDGAADHAAEDHDHAAEGEADHDHDGDGKSDHAAEEHDAAHEEGEEHDHDHDGDGKADHAAEEHDHAHEGDDHDHADHDHAHETKSPLVEELDVVLVGSVGGVPNPSDQSTPDFPFAKGQAIFFLVDPEVAAEAEEHAHTHAPGEECAFCAAHAGDAAHAIAVVQFADEKGKPLAVDSRELFELKEKETVVVKGKAKAAANGMITVDATGLYVRR
ncbi:hypothetical protein [Lacipirellula limnantheis]|uniref:Uncharacterized protein n=1 Tax=Lacipirellula limnantheis TaxID=2528024 RepID=A0A517TUF7_9BACT|nr:hypothetical protein [Lacipirellula limnantheis]QDT72000.1 hypothetical protein I41_11650 [Lacipirellula limnantheis]